jgi:hypothetical protein
VAGDDLTAAYLRALARGVPPGALDEIADGLFEARARHLAAGLDAPAAALAAISECGDPDLVMAAFRAHSPGRRAARTLLATGPLVGLCWASALDTGRAWTWPLPAAVPALLGATLLVVVATLAHLALTPRTPPRSPPCSVWPPWTVRCSPPPRPVPRP